MSLTDTKEISQVTIAQKLGATHKVGTPTSVTVLEVDSANNVIKAKGATVPTDADTGFAKGCVFIKTNGVVATTFYINEGSETSADFNAMETSASTVTGVTAGAGLSGGGTEGTVTLDVVNTDGNLPVTANSIDLANSPNIAANLTFTKEVNHTNTVTTSTTAATAGGNMDVAAGAGATTGAGGNYTASAGAGGNDAVGGNALFKGGAAGGGNRAGGTGDLKGGAGAGTGAGGAAAVTGGASGAGATGNGGASSVVGGAALSTNGNGGEALLTGGLATGTGTGGAATITGGLAGATNAVGGAATLRGGAGQGTGAGATSSVIGGASGAGATGKGGAANVTGGAAASTNDDGGSVNLTGGAKSGTGIDGVIFAKSRFCKKQGAPTAKTTSATLTAAELLTGIVTINQAAGASSAQQLPTGTEIQAALPTAFTTDDSFEVSFINTSTVDAEDASVTVNTDVTIVGSADIQAHSALAAQGSSALFRFRKTGDHVFVAYRIA